MRLRTGQCKACREPSTWFHSAVAEEDSVPRAACAGWSRPPPIWSTMCYRAVPCANGWSRSPGRCAWCSPARPDWLTRILGIVTRALSSALIRRAGLRRGDGAETAIITFIRAAQAQRSISTSISIFSYPMAPTLSSTTSPTSTARRHLRPPSCARLLDTLIVRITRALVHGGALIEEPEHPYLDQGTQLTTGTAPCRGATISYRGGPAGRAQAP